MLHSTIFFLDFHPVQYSLFVYIKYIIKLICEFLVSASDFFSWLSLIVSHFISLDFFFFRVVETLLSRFPVNIRIPCKYYRYFCFLLFLLDLDHCKGVLGCATTVPRKHHRLDGLQNRNI